MTMIEDERLPEALSKDAEVPGRLEEQHVPVDDAPPRLHLLEGLEARHLSEPKPSVLPAEIKVVDIKRVERLFQPRALDVSHLVGLGRVLARGEMFDPLTVIQVGSEAVLIDGHHRWHAYSRATVEAPVSVRYFEGTVRQAVIEAGEANHKAKLPMTNEQRQNRAWHLVLLGYSKSSVRRGAGVSDGQVGRMKRALRVLGERAPGFESWFKASREADGIGGTVMDDDAREEWIEAQALEYSERLHKHFGSQLTGNIELAARALEYHFGAHLPALIEQLQMPGAEETGATADEF